MAKSVKWMIMVDRVMLFGILISIGALVFILELVRRRKLREDYSLLWLVTGVILLLLSLWRSGLDTIANFLGVITYPPAALFAVAILFVLFILLQYSVALTRVTQQNKQTAQQMAILRYEVSQLQAALASERYARQQDNDESRPIEGGSL